MSVTPQNVNKVNDFIANPQCPSKEDSNLYQTLSALPCPIFC